MAAAIGDLRITSVKYHGHWKRSTKLSDGLNKCAKDKATTIQINDHIKSDRTYPVVCIAVVCFGHPDSLSVTNNHQQDA